MSQMGVYKLHKLARVGNHFTQEVKVRIERDNHVIQNSYAEEVNANSELNGLFYEKDEKSTELYLSGKPFKQGIEYTDFEEVKPKGRKPKKTEEKTNEEEELNKED